ncbi:MAG: hypothetical protein BIFFINMI_01186 [Phycisphaerae bacterium]|nr:hypothetical protein [Phycisphaerae bacterium]
MTTTRTSERRNSVRIAGSYPVQLWDHRGRLVGRGRTGNLSESGMFVLVPGGRGVSLNSLVRVEIELPRSPDHPRMTRRVTYQALVVRIEPMGDWRGLGLDLVDKVC